MTAASNYPSDRGVLIRAENVAYAPRSRPPVLRDINLTLHEKSRVLLRGANGAGKTTLLRLLRGDLANYSGRVSWRDGATLSTSRIAARKLCALVSPVSERAAATSATTVKTLLTSGFHDEFSELEIAEELAISRLRSFAGENLWSRELRTLSSGQLRLALLARALLRRPALLLLDEFADGLDRVHERQIFAALEDYAQNGALILTSHRESPAPGLLNENLLIENSRLSPASTPAPAIIRRKTEAASIAPGSEILRLRAVDVYIAGKKILKNINWTTRQGEHWRVRGPNGAGKSTLSRLLAGDETVACGGIIERLDPETGENTRTLSEIRKKISLVAPRLKNLYGYPLSALDLVCSGYANEIGKYRDYTETEIADALALMRKFGVENLKNQSIREVSTGQLARLYLARSLVCEPRVLILDEACAGLDAPSRDAFLNLLDDLAADDRAPQIIVVAHNEADCPTCVNRSARMEDGRLFVD